MSCCGTHSGGIGRFFSWFARSSRRRYLKKGLGEAQKKLLQGMESLGFEGASVLEIGCGVGYLHQETLRRGAARAIGVDLSEKMLAEARRLADEHQLAARTDYHVGDFVALSAGLPDPDVTILDKVVCCYPDPQTLLDRSVGKTARIFALTYPRAHLVNYIVTALEATLFWIIRLDFRPYVHDPIDLDTWIRAHGFRKHLEDRTFIWAIQVYTR